MKKSKIFCLAAVAVLLFTLAACGGYTSKIYDNAQKWIKKDVLESNMTKAPDAEDSDLPKEICRLIKNNKGRVDNLSIIHEDLKKTFPSFDVKQYGFSRLSSFIRSFNTFKIKDNVVQMR